MVRLKIMGRPAPAIPPGKDSGLVLAAVGAAGDNPFFARSVVNRIWFHLNGRGLVDPVDDFRDSNPPANDELLDALAKDFIVGKLLGKKMSDEEMLTELYLTMFARRPEEGAVKAALEHVAKAKRKGCEDVQWALLNAKEFLFRR